MKRLSKSLLIIVAILFFGCDAENPVGNLTGSLVDHSECLLKTTENTQVPSSQSCVSFTYANQTLFLTHYNAGFNCCPGTLAASFNLQNDTLYVLESESEPLCDCNCLYDLEMEVNQLNPGTYILKMVEPYISDPSEVLVFSFNLNDSTSGTFCVDRNNYPWNL